MRSKVAQHASRELIEAARKLTHEQRLAAFFEHNRLIAQLYLVGQQQRAKVNDPDSRSLCDSMDHREK